MDGEWQLYPFTFAKACLKKLFWLRRWYEDVGIYFIIKYMQILVNLMLQRNNNCIADKYKVRKCNICLI